MTTLFNSFESVTPAGTTITTANSSGADGSTAFDFATVGTSGTFASAAGAAHGSLCAALEDTAAATTDFGWLSTGPFGAQATAYYRLYAYITAYPGSSVRLFNVSTAGGGTSVSSLSLNTSGKLVVTYSNSGTNFVTFTNSVPLNAWFRVEGFVIASASARAGQCQLFSSELDESVPDEKHTSAQTLATGALSSTT